MRSHPMQRHPMQAFQVQTGARLHFGLLDVVAPFGGLGVMVDEPETILQFLPARELELDAAIESRASPIVHRLTEHFHLDSPPNVRIELIKQAPAHFGLGSGTQVSMAIAEGLCLSIEQAIEREVLAGKLADRGKRSAVGAHGYFDGGLIFEESRAGEAFNQVVERVETPSQWRMVLCLPQNRSSAVFGSDEVERFDALQSARQQPGDELRTWITDHILPAARSGDFNRFADAVYHYNHASGMLFADVQQGPYNGAIVSHLVSQIRQRGYHGVGQSSWGPGVFAWCKTQADAERLAQEMSGPELEIRILSARPTGRTITALEV